MHLSHKQSKKGTHQTAGPEEVTRGVGVDDHAGTLGLLQHQQ